MSSGSSSSPGSMSGRSSRGCRGGNGGNGRVRLLLPLLLLLLLLLLLGDAALAFSPVGVGVGVGAAGRGRGSLHLSAMRTGAVGPLCASSSGAAAQAPPQTSIVSATKGGARKQSKRPSKQSFFGAVRSYLAIFIMGIICRIFLQGANRIHTVGQKEFHDILFHKDASQPLLTVSNHMSVLDDPGIWGAIMPFWRMRPSQMRWSICTDDIYNAVPGLSAFYSAGNTLPIKRRLPMEQPMFEAFFKKLNEGKWCHIFAEGRVRQPWRFQKGEAILGEFKPGVGRLIMRCEKLPIIVPIYHIGMHRMAPEKPVRSMSSSSLQKFNLFGQKATVYFGKPIDLSSIVRKWKNTLGNEVIHAPWSHRSTAEELACHSELADAIRSSVLELEASARRDFYGRSSSSSAY